MRGLTNSTWISAPFTSFAASANAIATAISSKIKVLVQRLKYHSQFHYMMYVTHTCKQWTGWHDHCIRFLEIWGWTLHDNQQSLLSHFSYFFSSLTIWMFHLGNSHESHYSFLENGFKDILLRGPSLLILGFNAASEIEC